MSVQFFIHDDDEMKAYNVFKALVEPLNDAVALNAEFMDYDPNVGRALNNPAITPYAPYINPTIFNQIHGVIARMMQQWGATDIIEFMELAYQTSIIILDEKPMVLRLVAYVSDTNTENNFLIGRNPNAITNQYILARDGSMDEQYILLKKFINNYMELDQLLYLLRATRPYGELWRVEYRNVED